MKKITTVVAAMAIGAAAIGIGITPAAADPNPNCQTAGGATVCAQGGDVRGGGQSVAPNGPVAGPPGVGGCLTPYGTYQSCNAGR
jgi:hypothetical protein